MGMLWRRGPVWAGGCGSRLLSKERLVVMPNGRKRKRKKIATHKRKKRLRKNRHKKK